MALIPRHFSELLKCKFIIPPYQRGYRWDNEQVSALLDDFKEFVFSIKRRQSVQSGQTSFYCLQPIVVVPSGGNAPGDPDDPRTPIEGTYTVIDGQQRLTTIYLLLRYLNNFGLAKFDIFSLKMSARPQQQEFLEQGEFAVDSSRSEDNIDTFYMRRAYETIEEWFKEEDNQYLRMDILRILTEPYKSNSGYTPNDVRIIWYEISHMSASEAFRRLNYGKIPLTSAELVKALILQGHESALSAPYRRAVEWDNMEHALNNRNLWSMLVESSESKGSHMTLVLDFVADDLNQLMKKKDAEGKETVPFVRKSPSRLKAETDARDYFNYHVINEYINRKSDNSESRETVVEEIWSRIRDMFNLITNWYDNRQWYHLIGLMRILQDPHGKRRSRDFIRDVYRIAYPNEKGQEKEKEARLATQSEFTDSLRRKVGSLIRLGEDVTLDSLRYGNNNEEIIKILTALNVYEAMNDRDSSLRFAFADFEDFKITSLEHIHPQNITTDDSYDDFMKWFENRVDDKNHFSEADWMKIATQGKDPLLKVDERERLVEELKERVREAESEIRRCTADKKQYHHEKDTINVNVKVFDRLFGDLSGIDENELHSISNLALVDKDTNSALQNYFLDRKRGILYERHYDKSKGEPLTYVPVATFKVFAKEWSRSTPGDMRLWRPEDRDKYLKAIEKAYKFFTDKSESR